MCIFSDLTIDCNIVFAKKICNNYNGPDSCVSVMFAYEQCLLCLGHHPDIWIEAAFYLEQTSRILAEKGVSKLSFVH